MRLLSADPAQARKAMQNKLIFFFKRRDPLYLKVPILVPFSLMYVRFSIWRPSIISHVKTCGRALSSAYFHNYDLRRKWRVEEIVSSAPWSKSEQGCSCLRIWNAQVFDGLSMNITSPEEWAVCTLHFHAVSFSPCQVVVWHFILLRMTHASWILCLHLVYFPLWNYKFHEICNYDCHTIMCANTILDKAKMSYAFNRGAKPLYWANKISLIPWRAIYCYGLVV